MRKYAARIVLNILLILSVFVFPWWVTTIAASVLAIIANAPEIIFAGFLLDVLYGAPVPALGGFEFFFTALFAALWLVGRGIHLAIERFVDTPYH